jgi:hypothetical protein
LATIFLDYIIGSILEYFYFRQSRGRLYNITHTIEEQDANVLIMGSSRAVNQYNPDIISKHLGVPCFNAGQAGQSILYHKALLDTITERYNPNIIILDVNTNELEKNKSSYDLLAVLNPYINIHPILWDIISLRSSFERIKHLSKIYPYNSLAGRIVIGNTDFFTRDVSENGFIPLQGTWNDTLKSVTYQEQELDKIKINIFNEFVMHCKNKGIKVYVVLSPMFVMGTNNSSSINYIKQACKDTEIDFLSYQNSLYFLNGKYFYDDAHLNGNGADIFSLDISQQLKKYL